MTDTIFNFGKHPVRTSGTPERPLFRATDVCAALGIGDAASACRRLDQDEQELVSVVSRSSQTKALYVTESGLFALVITGRKSEAKAFRKWVTSEVLPAIRKHGIYELAESMERAKLVQECFRALPAKQAVMFGPLIQALRRFARPGPNGNGGTPPWARLIAGWIYDWTWKEHKSELRKRNPKQSDGTLVWRDYEALTDEGRRLVSLTIGMACFAASQSYSWADWRDRMETYFSGKLKLPMAEPERLLPPRRTP